jgi:hypothetical protein
LIKPHTKVEVLRHNYGPILQGLGDHNAATREWQHVIQLDPNLHNSIASVGHEVGYLGDLVSA